VAGWTALVAALLVAAGALVPLAPEFLTHQLDPSFGATLHFGAAHRYAVGSQLISTFGPLGFVFYEQYSADTFAWLLALRAVLAAATCWALAWLGYVSWASPWGGAVALLACAPFLAAPDVWFLTLPLLAVLIELPAARPPLLLRLLLGTAIGLVTLIKFTVLLAALAVLVPMTAAELLARRRMPAVTVAALVTTPLAWLTAGQRPADWLRYVDWSVREIFLGYSSAMQIHVHWTLTLQAALVSLAVLVSGLRLVRQRMPVGGWGAALALTGTVFMLFRAGFVRADVHVYTTVFGTLILAVLLTLLRGRNPRHLKAGALLILLGPGALFAHAIPVRHKPNGDFLPVFPHTAIGRLAALPLLASGDALERAQAQRAAAIRAANPLPPLRGAVDVYSHDQAVVLAHGLEFRPRPVFHSYMAYSPRLAGANADFLLGESAPEWILVRVAPIDRRLPALDDAPSWPLFMTRYRLDRSAGAFALLRKRERPLPWHLEPLERVETVTDSAIAVPPAGAGPIWARIDVRPSRRDAVVGTLLSPPLTSIAAVLNNGQQVRYRLVPALAGDGFVLSPLVRDTADFMRLESLEPDPAPANGVAVMSVHVSTAPGGTAGARAVTIEFFRLVVDER
jgi:hypothetical protein